MYRDVPRVCRKRLAALGVLSAIVAVGAGCAEPGPSPSERPRATASASPPGTVSPTHTPAATPGQSEEAEAPLGPEFETPVWRNAGEFGEAGGWEAAHSVAWSNDSFVALATRWEPINDVGFGRAGDRIWVSADGQSWTEIDMGPEFDGAALVDVVATPDGGFAAFGSRAGEVQPTGVVSSAAVWRSVDGRAWEEVESGLSEHLFIGKVVQGAMGYLLLVPQMRYGDPSLSGDPSLWFSADGLTWEEVHHYSQDRGYVKLDDIGAGDEGFVAVGLRQATVGGDWERFVAASADGRDWIDSPRPFGTENESLPDAAVAPVGADWFAVILQEIWFSNDGLDWERVESVGNGGGIMHAADGLVLLSPDAGLPYGAAGVMSSVDGRHWDPLDLGLGVSIGGAANSQLGPVLVGSIRVGPQEARAAFWFGRKE